MLNDRKNIIMMGFEQRLLKLQRDLNNFTGGGNYNLEEIIAMTYGGATIPVITAEDDFTKGQVGKYTDGFFYQKLRDTTSGQEFTPTNWRKVSTIDIISYILAIEEALNIGVQNGVGLSWRKGESINFTRSMITSNGIEPNGYQTANIVAGAGADRYLYENNVIGVRFNDAEGLTLKLGNGSSAQIAGDSTNLFDKIEYTIADTGANDFMMTLSMNETVQGTAKTLLAEFGNVDDSFRGNIFIEGGNVILELDNGTPETLSIPYNLIDGKLLVGLRMNGDVDFYVGNQELTITPTMDLSTLIINRVRYGYSSKYIAEANAVMFSGGLIGTAFGEYTSSPFSSSDSMFFNLYYNDGIVNTAKVGETRNLTSRTYQGDRMIADNELRQLLLSIAETEKIDFPVIINDQDFSEGEIGEYNDVLYYKRNNSGTTGFDPMNWIKFSIKTLIENIDASPIRTYLSEAQMVADTSLELGELIFIPLDYKQYVVVDTVEQFHQSVALDNGLFAQMETYTQNIDTAGASQGNVLKFDGAYFKTHNPSKATFYYKGLTPIRLSTDTPTYATFDSEDVWNVGVDLIDSGTTIHCNTGDGRARYFRIDFRAVIDPVSNGDAQIFFGLLISRDGGTTWEPIDADIMLCADGKINTSFRSALGLVQDGDRFKVILEANQNVDLITTEKTLDGYDFIAPAIMLTINEVL